MISAPSLGFLRLFRYFGLRILFLHLRNRSSFCAGDCALGLRRINAVCRRLRALLAETVDKSRERAGEENDSDELGCRKIEDFAARVIAPVLDDEPRNRIEHRVGKYHLPFKAA